MGVPGFFLWLWKKYKGKHFVFDKASLQTYRSTNKNNIKENENILKDLDTMDYFLIDTNCLIHPVCFKTLDDNPNLTNQDTLEKKMITNVLEYLDKLIRHVNPKKGVYVSIDGVAPVAKMKQQRSRRFKSVHDRKLWENIKKKHTKKIPFFWNNSAITPGTEFMRKLHFKILEWSSKQTVNVIYSSSNTPSEGEHKLLQFIRENQRKKEHYKYVIYGLDADLIFLALATGSNDVFLLREAIHLNKKSKTDKFNYVSIKVMKEAIISTVERLIRKELDLNKNEKLKISSNCIISDFIFICYLLGNDFLPHLPSLNICKNGIDYLLNKYVINLIEHKLKFIIKPNAKNKINQKIFDSLIDKLALEEEQQLKINYSAKKRRYKCHFTEPYDIEIYRIENLQFKIKDPVKLGSDNMDDWRKRYYSHYFGTVDDDLEEFVERMVQHYMTGLKWITEYYFDKCKSWDWYFPYDHPPFLSDLKKYGKKYKFTGIKLILGKPVKPFVQLLTVLPPQSNYLLPKQLQKIMLNHNSTVAHLYPTDFTQDFIGKARYWMAIPNLPPLEIELLKRSYAKYKDKLTNEDNKKNKSVKNYLFSNTKKRS